MSVTCCNQSGTKPGSAAVLRLCVLGASWRKESLGEAVSPCPCYEGLCVCAFPPAAFQPPCCLPQPRTKHIAAPEQHGVLSYLPAAAAVLAPDAPVLSRTRCRPGRAAAARSPPWAAECTVQPHLHPSHRHGAGRSHLVPGFGVRLEKEVLARFVLWICYFCSLLDMVQTERCIFFSDSL